LVNGGVLTDHPNDYSDTESYLEIGSEWGKTGGDGSERKEKESGKPKWE